jgi:hypothetical protein
MKHRYLSTKVILPVAVGSVLLAPEVLDVSIVVDPPGIVVVLGTCDAVGVIEAEVVPHPLKEIFLPLLFIIYIIVSIDVHMIQ